MNRSFILKIVSIGILTLFLSFAVSYINSMILERQALQSEVEVYIASSSAGRQTLAGPILVIPYTEQYDKVEVQEKGNKTVRYQVESALYVLPDTLQLKGDFSTAFKASGIYKALLYKLNGSIDGQFKIPEHLVLLHPKSNSSVTWGKAYLSVGLSDQRGISSNPVLDWNGNKIAFEQGTQQRLLDKGMHANLGRMESSLAKTIPFSLQLSLSGMESFDFVPIANVNTISLNSTWQSPHFAGSFLPEATTQKIDSNGFKANWAVSSIASNIQEKLLNDLADVSDTNKSVGINNYEALSVSFVEPVTVYSQANRATKYGLLFITLTFAGFFLFEIMKRLPIHPAQYTMVGLAMAMFYLLLISLSEHISFALSYLSATLACVALLGYYLSHILQNKRHGMTFAGLLTVLYAALYGILVSEDNALLMGSLLVFGLLAAAMIATRKVDWYQVGATND